MTESSTLFKVAAIETRLDWLKTSIKNIEDAYQRIEERLTALESQIVGTPSDGRRNCTNCGRLMFGAGSNTCTFCGTYNPPRST